MECFVSVNDIRRYFDGEMKQEERDQFYLHLPDCIKCQEHFEEVKKTIALTQSASHIEAPPAFTSKVMDNLPHKKPRRRWKTWIHNHPLIVAALVCFIFSSIVFWLIWIGSDEVTISGEGNVEVIRETNTVLVPEGEMIEGDLVVRNGNVDVQGEVHGDLTVIHGEMSTTGQVTGDVEEINQMLAWIWYEIKTLTKDTWSSS
ncbi:anti-sigma factor RsiW [Geomicrobium halophilum]|uniref:Anti-sigma factor RsiW n=1 Tax=Geomicrobium halophilum TaxID=549000 RepID=A0A841PRF1_9BACL|nr:anti-sigma factor [Geomicrobium halophilum]MBB6451370.1 anti-sigma factor RsiW [Geomicrobium halophilum]